MTELMTDENGDLITSANNIITDSSITLPPIIVEGLMLRLDADIPASYPGTGDTWFDLSDRGNDITLKNGPTYNATNGSTMTFDGIDDYGIRACNDDFVYETGDFAIETWFYCRAYPIANHGQFIYSRGHSAWMETAIIIQNNQKISCYMGHVTIVLEQSGTYALNTWNHVVVTRVSGVSSLYVNTILGDTSSTAYNFTNNTDPVAFGAPYDGFGTATPFDGDIGIFNAYKGQGLSAIQVQQNFDAVKSRFGL